MDWKHLRSACVVGLYLAEIEHDPHRGFRWSVSANGIELKSGHRPTWASADASVKLALLQLDTESGGGACYAA